MSSEFEALFFVKSWIERGAKKSHASSGLNAYLRAVLAPKGGTEQFVTQVTRRGNEQVLTGETKAPESLWDAESSDYFLCGYGTGRRAAPRKNYDPVARDDDKGRRYQRVASLLEEEFELTSISG